MTLKRRYRDYIIHEEAEPVFDDRKVWVHNKTGVGKTYLQTDGTTKHSALEGWFESMEHAERVIRSITSSVCIGGE